MKFRNTITMLVLAIAILSFLASAYGLFSDQGSGQAEFQSIHGQTVSTWMNLGVIFLH